MASRKRSRSDYSKAAQALVAYRPLPRPPLKRRKAFIPGRDRRSGYYGRFAGGGGELKFHDVDLDDAVIASAGTVTPSINLIPQGVTEVQRIGRKCVIRQIHWKYQVSLPQQDAGATPGSGETVRIILFVDKQCNGATATVANILESANFQSFRNLANSGRFNILLDKSMNMNYLTMASDGVGFVSHARQVRDGTFNKKCNIPIEFDNTTGAITEIRSNNLGVLLISSPGFTTFDSKIRLRFSDS